jgi:hypothetical protein
MDRDTADRRFRRFRRYPRRSLVITLLDGLTPDARYGAFQERLDYSRCHFAKASTSWGKGVRDVTSILVIISQVTDQS